MSAPTVELIIIGSELLLGEALDTNTRTLARALRSLGLALRRVQIVGDEIDRLREAIIFAWQQADIVITTGGLGPTVDDPTRQAVAKALNRPLEFRPELWEQVSERVRRYGRIPSENQRRQAYVPRGAVAVSNPVGTAPAFLVEEGRKTLISLPGVPHEMETLLQEHLIPYLRQRYQLETIIKIRTLHAAGVGESWVDEQIGEYERLANPAVGLAAHAGVIDIRLAARAESEAEAEALIHRLEQEICLRLGKAIFGTDDDTLENVTLAGLARHGWRLAICEAGTEGTLAKRLAAYQGEVYLGGETVTLSHPLSEETARIQEKYGTSAALGLALRTSTESQEVELWWRTPQGERGKKLSYGGHPAYAARWAANMALDSLRRFAEDGEAS